MSDYSKARRNALLMIGVLGIIYLVISSFYLLKIIDEDTCASKRYTSYDGGTTTIGYNMTTNNEIVMVNNPYEHGKNTEKIKLCLSLNSSDVVNLRVVDLELNILANDIINGSVDKCYFLEEFNFETSKIGVMCVDCDINNNLFLYEEVVSANEEITVVKNGVYSVFSDKALDIVLIGYNSCWDSIRYFTVWYLTGTIMLMIIVLLLVGFDKAEKVLFKDD